MKLYRNEKDYWNEIMSEVSAIVQKHTIPFFTNFNDEVKYLGAGVFICINERYFVVSACHVINSNTLGQLFVPIDNYLLLVNGDLKTTSTSKGFDEKLDKIDLSILEINQTLVNEIYTKYEALPRQRIGVNHDKIFDEERYLILGPPDNFVKVASMGKQVTIKYLGLPSSLSNLKYYETYGFNERDHILLEYPKWVANLQKKMNKLKSPEPYGISGSGLWFVQSTIVKLGEVPNYEPNHVP